MSDSSILMMSPPLTNRGGKMPARFTVGVDWFQGTFPRSSLDAVRALLDGYLRSFSQVERPRKFRYLSSAVEWSSGHRLCFDAEVDWFYVESNGSSIAALSESLSLALLTDLLRLGLRLTRVDVFRDDYEKALHPSVLKEWADGGLLRRFKVYGLYQIKEGELNGSTFFAGRRGDCGSGSYVRYYDKSQLRRDRADCYRLEVEFSGDKAKRFGGLLLGVAESSLEISNAFLSGVCTGALDFTEEPGRVRLSRSRTKREWSQYCGDDGRIRINHAPKVRSIAATVNAFCTQWGGLLSNLSTLGLPVLLGILRGAVKSGVERGFKSIAPDSQDKLSSVFRLSSDAGTLMSELGRWVLSESEVGIFDSLQLDLLATLS